jgi:hypothetical protein
MSREFDTMSHADGLHVLETTDGDAWLGQLGFRDGAVVVHSGFVGRPRVVPAHEVLAITPAEDHPDVLCAEPLD